MNDSVLLRISKICKSFEHIHHTVSVLQDVSFEVVQCQSLVMTGPSGSGKSTLLHLIGALDKPSSGEIEINGTSLLNLSELELAKFRNQMIGFVFQDHHLLPQYSVLENVLIPTMAFKNMSPNSQKRAIDLLEKIGLSDRISHRPAELSGGERQRVAIARALINQPSIILCDEPTGNLDHATANTVTSLLFDLHQTEQNILVVVTHNRDLEHRFDRRFVFKENSCIEV
ncbi:ATP-binding protein [Candidatus Poribacteria bacterium]|jgi:lipoprotein-releasing system ATP-binding protein|nr:ATP-binding protein [Candidatus Poribacteria bacterium]MBD68648.1 ATP-binding protein [Candidatus Poribacteria bacterium]MBD70172.1 ATP-binding protein [Candidatus Poribacteria bacterium]|tara:strand:+ start:2402 stop:3085 length:684 start_codon:yes stop_codon:yes gene_type:complete